MPISTYWVDEPTIIGFNLSGEITTEDIHIIGQDGLALVQKHPCSILMNFTNTRSLPKNLVNAVLRSNAFIAFINHNNAHQFVFVQPNTAARFMIDTIFRNVQVTITEDYEQGVCILRKESDNGEKV